MIVATVTEHDLIIAALVLAIIALVGLIVRR